MAVRGILSSLGLGAGLMYFFDPALGRRRRAVARDKMIHWSHRANHALEVVGRDMSHRIRGMTAGFRHWMSFESPGQVPDGRLEARVHTALGRHCTHPGSVEVRAQQGHVTLKGPILAPDVDEVLATVRRVRGVREIDNQMDVRNEPGDIPGLQGPGYRRPALAQANWPPATRLAAGALGTLLMVNCTRHPNPLNVTLGTLGFGLFVRAATNMEIMRALGLGGSRRGIDFQKTINIQAPVDKVFSMWTHYDNFPRFMHHVREVRDLGNGRSNWRVAGPMGTEIQWDAVCTRQEPNRMFAWRTEPGSVVAHAGIIHFEPNADGSTRVHLQMSYSPPAGVAGHWLASLFSADPKHEMDQDLLRMKSYLETGKTPRDAAMAQGMTND